MIVVFKCKLSTSCVTECRQCTQLVAALFIFVHLSPSSTVILITDDNYVSNCFLSGIIIILSAFFKHTQRHTCKTNPILAWFLLWLECNPTYNRCVVQQLCARNDEKQHHTSCCHFSQPISPLHLPPLLFTPVPPRHTHTHTPPIILFYVSAVLVTENKIVRWDSGWWGQETITCACTHTHTHPHTDTLRDQAEHRGCTHPPPATRCTL